MTVKTGKTRFILVILSDIIQGIISNNKDKIKNFCTTILVEILGLDYSYKTSVINKSLFSVLNIGDTILNIFD